ncbi:beta-ketoadipate enol-lactone hydrolase [Roridomyces roridus]|uniref:Beta-ketoadipate enol-lactone hydrolase n=1 Tax=Roridomyces roridus TaxID=1738132 RepID=A0AAD7FWQ2_9AGAR|nr:beta-ketoadipate enol-lactone hydrolase [Roridomyces roridus]
MSRLIPGRFPPQGTSPIADRIRERRGVRGLTPLDGALLHVPPVAEGWNTLLGSIRTKGHLPGDVRELMILRVAARNHAAFEWIHHEHVGRSHGLDTTQLWAIRDTTALAPPALFSPLQAAALAFADYSTTQVRVPAHVTSALQEQLKVFAESSQLDADDLLVEAAAIVASYNMVSRFLVSLDVAGKSDDLVPWPVDRTEHTVPIDSGHIHAVTLVTHPDAPWLVFANSLLTDETMWDWLIPAVLAPRGHTTWPFNGTFNILLHAQRGHGHSATPPAPCTIPILAHDIAALISALIPGGKAKSVIGVSQGGAAALAFGALYPTMTRSIIACDTGPRTAPGNAEAWQGRIALAKTDGIATLATATVDRWFPAPSPCATNGTRSSRTQMIKAMIEATTIPGFELGAGALMQYDLIKSRAEDGVDLLASNASGENKILLVAGALDGGGKVAAGMKGLCDQWNATTPAAHVAYAEIPGAGHLPMVDETEKFWEVVGSFLTGL